ncbi:7081_t:CDS:2 [Funneliformis caledonium]|uniref:7081_t:CDS:1 n=1 Tax=Funneliformis caledonium TaxID=1117310 RepID=A0A9N8VNK8_9GLOM|nr:7081_t:CDS:2 [Funneliformis caledonium]
MAACKISKKPKTDDMTSHILLLVTCYSEGEIHWPVRIFLTSSQLLMVIADDDITGSDNDKTTPEICEDLIETFNLSNSESPIHSQSYLTVGEDGTPEERKGLKAGNRGKRDSGP